MAQVSTIGILNSVVLRERPRHCGFAAAQRGKALPFELLMQAELMPRACPVVILTLVLQRESE